MSGTSTDNSTPNAAVSEDIITAKEDPHGRPQGPPPNPTPRPPLRDPQWRSKKSTLERGLGAGGYQHIPGDNCERL